MTQRLQTRLALLALTAVSLGLIFTATPYAQQPDPRPFVPELTKATPAQVVRVIDGDTLVVSLDGKEFRVRLVGVGTPKPF